LVPEAAILGRHLVAADRLCQCASDASDGVHLAAMEDVCQQDRPEMPDADAGKLAVLEPDAPAQDDSQWADLRSAVPAESAAPCKPGVAPSVERSCAVQVAVGAAWWAARLQPDVVAEPEAQSARSELMHSPVAEA
jgi:hypothetical protein